MTTWFCFNYLDVNNCAIIEVNSALFQGFAQMLMCLALIGLQFSLTFPLIGLYFMVSHNWFFLFACNKADNKPSLAQVNISSHFCSFALPCCWKVEWIDIDVEYAMIKHQNLYGVKPWTFIQPGSWNQPWHWHRPRSVVLLYEKLSTVQNDTVKTFWCTEICAMVVLQKGHLLPLIERRKMLKTLAWWPWPFPGRVLDESMTDTAASLPLLWSHKPML